MSNDKKDQKASDPKIWKTVKQDVKEENLKQSFLDEIKELYNFYLDKEHKESLDSMSWFKKVFYFSFWLFKSAFFKLRPFRRILLLVALVLSFTGVSGDNINVNTFRISYMMMLFILLLEMKDRILAKDELETGRQVQQEMYPKEYPKLKGWDIWFAAIPAKEVGGDLVDYIKYSDGRLGLALGDVAGKGLGAALFMVKLQTLLKALAPDSENLQSLAVRLNRTFYKDNARSKFASLFYAEINQDNGNIKYLNAGHLPPFHASDLKVELLPRGDMALGLSEKGDFSEYQCELKSDDILIIFSDGVTEAIDKDNKFLGDERLKTMLKSNKGLSADKLGEKILNSVESFTAGVNQFDDISMIVLKKK